MKYKERAVVVRQKMIATDICDLVLKAGDIVPGAVPGQFVSVYSNDKSRLLPRPISICEADRPAGTIRLVYRVAGSGTKEFSGYRAGETLDLVGPLGNGFPMDALYGKRVMVIGGGIGIPPLLMLSRQLSRNGGKCTAVLGYRDSCFLAEEFEKILVPAGGSVVIATENGSQGTKGTVLDAVKQEGPDAEVICACGPLVMLRAIKEYAMEQGMECYLSMEERMACGIGACLACVCASSGIDEHSRVKNKRICAEGPVFAAEEIEL